MAAIVADELSFLSGLNASGLPPHLMAMDVGLYRAGIELYGNFRDFKEIYAGINFGIIPLRSQAKSKDIVPKRVRESLIEGFNHIASKYSEIRRGIRLAPNPQREEVRRIAEEVDSRFEELCSNIGEIVYSPF